MKRFAAIAVLVAFATTAAAQPAGSGKRYAILVGVGEYDHPNLKPLAYAERDALELGRLLKDKGYVVDLLTPKTGAQQPTLKPTLTNIRARLVAALAKCEKGDIVLVGMAGHGLQFAGDKDSYFCPAGAKPFPQQKATLLSIKQVYDELDQSNAGVKLMLVDACRDDPAASRGVSGDVAPRPPRGVAALFSCAVGQRAYELDRYKHGVFFYHVIEGLKGAARDDDNDVTWYSLSNYVRKRVNRDVQALVGRGARQEPHGVDELIGEPPILVSLSPQPRIALRPTNPAAPPQITAPLRRVPAEQCLPDDTKLVAHFNVHQMAKSPVLRPVVLEITNSLAAEGQKNAELDLVKDTRTYYFAFHDLTGQHVGILQGSYLPETFEQAFRGNTLFEPAKLPGVQLAFRQKETKFVVAMLDREAIGYAFTDAAMQDLAAKRAGERVAKYSPALRSVMGSINREMSITVGFPDRTMWATDAFEKQLKGAKRVGAFRLSAYFGDAIYLNGAAGLSNPADAKALATTLAAERATGEAEFAKQNTPDGLLLTALLRSVRIETAGPTQSGVSIKSKLSPQDARPFLDEFIKGFKVGFAESRKQKPN